MHSLYLKLIFFTLILFLPTYINAASYSCDGEVVTNIDGSSVDANQSFYESSSASQGHARYFQFTPNNSGNLNFSIEKNGENQIIDIGTSCSNDDVYEGSDDDSDYSGSFSVTSGTTYYIVVEEKNPSQTLEFTLGLEFVADPLSFICSNPKDFTRIFSSNDYQKTLLIGNTSLCADDNRDGVCEDPGTSRNNNIYMINHDADSDSATTKNSSAALLNMPSGKEVVFAGLFWQGYIYNKGDTEKNLATNIKFKHEAGSYQSLTADEFNWVYYGGDASQAATRFYYQGFKDVTSIVNSYKEGDYWVGDLESTEGDGGSMIGGGYGAWSLVVVYKDSDEIFRNASIFHGFKGVVGSGDVSGADAYATNNSCTLTGVGNTVSSTLSGFITPKENTVDSTLFVFAGEGDKTATGDSGSITDSSGTAHSLTDTVNPSSDIMNSTISVDGVHVTTGTPHFSTNSLGIDIDTYDVSSFIDNEQSSTTITLTTSGDGYQPGMYALETQLFVPDLCYDYAYKQNHTYFTEDNDGSKDPYITGAVSTSSPITVGLFIKNRVPSDINITDLTVDIYDINTSILTYVRDSTELTPINAILSLNVPDNNPGRSVDDAYTKGIEVGNMDSNDHVYVYYDLDPLTTTLHEPIYAKASYNMTIGGSTIPYETVFGKNTDLCTDSNFRYQPAENIFTMVHNDYFNYELGGTSRYYNLPTQVVRRPGNFKLVAMDINNTHTPINVSSFVAVELIDLDVYHDSNASCLNPDTSISQKVWIHFNDTNSTNFDRAAIQSSIANNLTDLLSPENFYSTARRNVTFRMSFNTTRDGNEDLIQTEEGTGSNAGLRLLIS